MNVELMRRIADAIEREPEKFDMGDFYNEDPYKCETIMCVGGWAVCLTNPGIIEDGYSIDFEVEGAEALGLDGNTAGSLFFRMHVGGDRGDSIPITAKNAPAMLRWMADHRVIDWDEAFEATRHG
jgi:hypothetical protein